MLQPTIHKAMGAAQELDMDALENVAGGRIVERDEIVRGGLRGKMVRTSYDVVDEATGKVVKTFGSSFEAGMYDNGYHRR